MTARIIGASEYSTVQAFASTQTAIIERRDSEDAVRTDNQIADRPLTPLEKFDRKYGDWRQNLNSLPN